jgi:hypothetical protein
MVGIRRGVQGKDWMDVLAERHEIYDKIMEQSRYILLAIAMRYIPSLRTLISVNTATWLTNRTIMVF